MLAYYGPEWESLQSRMVDRWCTSFSGNTGLQFPSTMGRNHGVLTNFANNGNDAYVASPDKLALDFDGLSNRVSLDSSASNFRSLSQGGLSFWFNLRPQTICAAFHFGQGSAANNLFTVFFGDATGSLPDESVAITRTSGGAATFTGFERKGHSFYFDQAWHHFCFVSGGFGHAAYIDGLRLNLSYPFSGSSSSTGFLNLANADVLRIGNRRINSTESVFLNGQIDDVTIFNTALTASEVRFIYEQGRGGGMLYQPPRRRSYYAQVTTFKNYWFRNQQRMIGGGIR